MIYLPAIYLQPTCIYLSSCRISAPCVRAKILRKSFYELRWEDNLVLRFPFFFFCNHDALKSFFIPEATIIFYTAMSMASHTFESKEGVIEVITNDFDKVGYTKADEADMAKQNKKQQFHVI